MKVFEFRNEMNWLQASAHLVITRDEPDKNCETLIAAGLIDVDSGVRGIAARALKGEWLKLLPSQTAYSHVGSKIRCDKYQYRIINKSLGKVTHTLLLHKSAVDDDLGPEQPRVLLIPDGGDTAALFARRFASDFNLPHVPEWKDVLWETCQRLEFVERLNVWTDPNIAMWREIQAFQMSSRLDEERAKQIVSELLSSGDLVLPEGVTEAPPLSEGMASDAMESEEGAEATPHVLTYLQTYAPHLATTIEDMAEPSHDLDRPIEPAIAKMARTPFPAQAHTIQAILNGLREQKGVIVSSDMGTGKSIVSLAVANALAQSTDKGMAVLLLVPGITIPKWVRDEIGKTLPNAKVTVFESWRDVVTYRKDRLSGNKAVHPLEFLLLSRDTAKLGMPKAPALIYKARHVFADRTNKEEPRKTRLKLDATEGLQIYPGTPDSANRVRILEDVWICPDCHGVQTKTDQGSIKKASEKDQLEIDQLRELKLGFTDLAVSEQTYNTFRIERKPAKRTQIKFQAHVQDYHCSACGTNLMRDMDPSRESVSGLRKRRLQPAWFIKKYLKGRIDLLIIDELHQYKTNSGQGEAMGAIVGAAKLVVGLTGTLSDGKASSLYHLLWRMAPGEMIADGLDHKSLNKFVHLYGSLEQKGRYAKDDSRSAGGNTNRKLIMNPPKEVPGLSPKLFVNHLADKCVFLELGDMGLPLVELEERPVFVDMEPEHARAYAGFHSELESAMKISYMLGNVHAFARFIPSVVNAANQPHRSQEVPLMDESVLFFATHSETQLSAKEQKLLEDLQEDLAQNRRCVVYVRFSGEAGQDQRLYDVLTRNGIHARVLKASVSPEDRVEWLEKSVKDDVQVVIANAKLVEVGLDLLDYPSLYFYQFTDEVATMRQAARRAWRIGQHRRCTIRYYVYNNTYEMIQFKRMMAKRSHAMLLEGRLDKSEVAAFAVKDDKSASTFSIASCLGNVDDLSQKWQALADKDVPTGVLLLEESSFKTEIGQAMQRLASETRRLAGVPEPVETALVSQVSNRPESNELIRQTSLFEQSEDPTQEPRQTSVVSAAEPTEESKPFTVGDMRTKMGLVTKAKKRDKVGNDQIMLFAI